MKQPEASGHGKSRLVCLRARRTWVRHSVAVLAAAVLVGSGVLLVRGTVAALDLAAAARVSPDGTPAPYPLQTQPPYTVALDPGHGGMDTGAEALRIEVDVCEATVDALYGLLEADPNYTPVRTRANGEDRSTSERAQTASDARASLLLSVHANCDESTRQSHGFECYPTPPGRTYSQESLRFAQCVVFRMAAAGHRLRGESGIHYAYYSGSSKHMVEASDTTVRTQKSFGMVEKPLCPALLAEQCFLSNYSDTEAWASPEGCVRAAQVYYRAICDYFGTVPLLTNETQLPAPQ